MKAILVLALIALISVASVEAGRMRRESPSAIQLKAKGIENDATKIGTFNLVSRQSSKALDIYGGQTGSGAKCILYRTNGGNNQKFTLWRNKDNYYYIQAVHSGRVIDVNGSSKKAGEVMFQWDYHGGANQQWQLIGSNGKVLDFNSNGGDATSPRANWFFIKNRNSGMVLDVKGASTADEALIIQWNQKTSGTDNQLWGLVQD